MRIRDRYVSKFSQPLECLYQAMQIQEKKFSIAFIDKGSRDKTQNSLLWPRGYGTD